MKIISWNVNGLRAAQRHGLADYIAQEQPDVFCLQEIKCEPDAATEWADAYQKLWNPALRKGYSGTASFTKTPPLAVWNGIGEPEGDAEGRVQTLEFADFFLVNCYTPNSRNELVRLPFRIDAWDVAFRRYVKRLDKTKPVVFCGDLNVAHEEIDLARPKGNRRNAGFTDEERQSLTKTLRAGFVDTFRVRHPGEPEHYSWWSYRGDVRERNIGWRIDYVCVSNRFDAKVAEAFIRSEVRGSDHCPVGIVLDLG